MRRDTHYYPDTPLSLNHALMKGKPLRSEGLTPANLPQINYFGGGGMATLEKVGMKKLTPPVDEKPPPVF